MLTVGNFPLISVISWSSTNSFFGSTPFVCTEISVSCKTGHNLGKRPGRILASDP